MVAASRYVIAAAIAATGCFCTPMKGDAAPIHFLPGVTPRKSPWQFRFGFYTEDVYSLKLFSTGVEIKMTYKYFCRFFQKMMGYINWENNGLIWSDEVRLNMTEMDRREIWTRWRRVRDLGFANWRSWGVKHSGLPTDPEDAAAYQAYRNTNGDNEYNVLTNRRQEAMSKLFMKWFQVAHRFIPLMFPQPATQVANAPQVAPQVAPQGANAPQQQQDMKLKPSNWTQAAQNGLNEQNPIWDAVKTEMIDTYTTFHANFKVGGNPDALTNQDFDFTIGDDVTVES